MVCDNYPNPHLHPVVSIISQPSTDPSKHLHYIVTCHSNIVQTTVTSKASVVRNWLRGTLNHNRTLYSMKRLVVGLGVQSAPPRGENRIAAATLQLCVGYFCLIFQLGRCNTTLPSKLRSFLSDPDITFVGIQNQRDRAMLLQSRHHLQVDRLLDLRDVAWYRLGCSPSSSMEILAQEVLGVEGVQNDREVGRSDWGRYQLDNNQVMYASLDAFIASALGKELQAWNWGQPPVM